MVMWAVREIRVGVMIDSHNRRSEGKAGHGSTFVLFSLACVPSPWVPSGRSSCMARPPTDRVRRSEPNTWRRGCHGKPFAEGKTSVGRKAWFWGKAWAVDREAAFSYAEIKAMWKKVIVRSRPPYGPGAHRNGEFHHLRWVPVVGHDRRPPSQACSCWRLASMELG